MKLSDAEWTVMCAVWDRGEASARDVHESVSDATGWAYTTVKTVLARLAVKGAVSERKRANASMYAPLVTRDRARGSAVRSLIDRAFEGTFGSLVMHLVAHERLSKKERQQLTELYAELDPPERRS
jgi:predicted transcriptional regulator